MRHRPLLLLALALAGGCAHRPPAAPGAAAWEPGTYRGIITGRTTLAEARRVLGEPEETAELPGDPWEDPAPVTLLDFGSGDTLLPARVSLFVRRDTVMMVELVPANRSRAEVLRRLGPGWITARFRLCPGFEEAEEVPLYRVSAPGEDTLETLEYPALGITVHAGPEEVSSILLQPAPPGFPSAAACPRLPAVPSV